MRLSPILLLLFCDAALATERWAERWTEADGLPTHNVVSVAQDDAGALWFGTLIGAVRYDGHTFETVDEGGTPVRKVVFTSRGELLVPRYRRDPLRWLGGDAVLGPTGKPLTGVRDAVEHDGRIWITEDGAVRVLDGDTWSTALETRGNVQGLHLDGDTLVATAEEGVWRLAPGQPEQLSDHNGARTWHRLGSRVLMGDVHGNLVEWSPDGVTVLASGLGYPDNAVVRDGVYWASFENSLVRVGSGGTVERLGTPDTGAPGGIFVDREGNLWATGSRGVVRYPEPDAVMWTHLDGLPKGAIDHITLGDGQRWLLTRDVAVLHSGDEVLARGHARKPGALCVDSEGHVWTGGPSPATFEPILEVDPGSGPTVPLDEPLSGCVEGEETTWVATGSLIHEARLPLEPVAEAPAGAELGTFFSRNGRWAWLESERLCEAEPLGPWSCVQTPASFTQVRGDWARGENRLWLDDGASWRTVETEGRVEHIERSPRGGVWALGIGLAVRVDRDGRVLERLGTAQGMLDGSPTSLAEEEDGTLWVGSRSGLTRIPAGARTRAIPLPSVQVASIAVDGQERTERETLELPWDQNQVTVRLSAPTFRDPRALRYRMRIDGQLQEGADGTFRLVGLTAGSHVLEGQASLDGEKWSAPAVVHVHIARAPWLQWWAILLYVTFIGTAVTLAYRTRVAYLLGLERQRARIALDLHDEVGSGLGSIGLIASALPMLDDPGEAAQTIAETSAELGDALTGIVWALRPESDRAGEVRAFLEQRGRALFADGETRFLISGEHDPSVHFSLPVRRTVTGIALEALHNTAKYARASQVEVQLDGGRLWSLQVRDDGVGIDPDAPIRAGGGSGLQGMRTRARSIGAALEVQTGTEGTCITLTFDPAATDTRLR